MSKFLISLLGGVVGGIIVVGVTYYLLESKTNPFLDYYTTENAVAVSPHDLRMEMDKGGSDFIIVDLRSATEFASEHIRGAINIPGIANDANAAEQEQRIIAAFEKLPKDKRIIVHCYTHYCMLAKHVGLMLAKVGINVHELNIGWNEWKNEWDLWNGKGTSKSININDYIE
jgi:rhodanese-related sulfurtransferase